MCFESIFFKNQSEKNGLMFIHSPQVDPKYGGWWNDLDMIEIGNGGPHALAPAAAAAAGALSPALMYPWAVNPSTAGAGWAMGADGTVTNGGLCLTAASLVVLTACNTSDGAQQFVLEHNGNLHLKANGAKSCLALLGGSGPGLTMWTCKQGSAGANEEFTLTNGQLCTSTVGRSRKGSARCLKPEAQKPGGGGDDGFNCKRLGSYLGAQLPSVEAVQMFSLTHSGALAVPTCRHVRRGRPEPVPRPLHYVDHHEGRCNAARPRHMRVARAKTSAAPQALRGCVGEDDAE